MDYVDKLTFSEPETISESAGRNGMGILQVNCMAVPARCTSSAEMDKWEAGYEATCSQQLPVPFWSDDGTLEPFNSNDLEMLKAAGVTPEEMELLLLEEHLERRTP
jgi:hypothetical protein